MIQYVCIKLGVPETGDPDLDEIIKKSQRQKFISIAMQGICAKPDLKLFESEIAKQSVLIADGVMKLMYDKFE